MKRVIVMNLAAFAAGCLTCASRLMGRPAQAAAVLLLLPMVPGSAAETPPDLGRVARDLPRSLDLQTELPLTAPVDQSWSFDVPNFVFWIVVVVGAAVLAYCMYEILPAVSARRAPWEEARGDGGYGPAGSGADPVRTAADELAQHGRFVEAMHVLLLQGLDEMRTRLDLRFADSLTSREIVTRANAPAGAKTALRDIIAWVERAYFGDHPVDRSDYDACRRSYVTLDSVLRAGGNR